MSRLMSACLGLAFVWAGTAACAEMPTGQRQEGTTPPWKRDVSTAVLEGRCEDARVIAIKAGDFDLAEQALRLCHPQSITSPNSPAPKQAAIEPANLKDRLARAQDFYDKADYSAAFPLLRDLANDGDPDAQNKLGLMYQQGLGISKNSAEGLNWFKKAASNGSKLASYNLGVLYMYGQAGAKDYNLAMSYFVEAGPANAGQAYNNIGVMYRSGLGVPKNLKTAIKYYKLAAEIGSSTARGNLSDLINAGLASEADMPVPTTGTHEPDWKRKPTIQEIAAFYPREAVKARVTGKVVVQCAVDEEGLANSCSTVSEEPVGYGFSAAAVRLARLCEFTPKMVDGKVTTGTVRIPFNFSIPEGMMQKLLKSISKP